MPNIRPVSDLRNYAEVLKEISFDEPVFLTKNGRGRYAIVDIEEYEKTKAIIKLMGKLAEAEKSAEENGWISNDEYSDEYGNLKDIPIKETREYVIKINKAIEIYKKLYYWF